MKPTRDQEWVAAGQLVSLLVSKLCVPISPYSVTVEKDWKVKFKFTPLGDNWRRLGSERYGRGVGLEVHFGSCTADVDSRQWAGDLWTLAAHGWQIAKKWLRWGREERPSKLLRRAEKELDKVS